VVLKSFGIKDFAMRQRSETMTNVGEPRGSENISRYGAYVVGIVMFSFMLSFLDRQVLTLLLQPIKTEYRVADMFLAADAVKLLGGAAQGKVA
jgi:hypothetical protein